MSRSGWIVLSVLAAASVLYLLVGGEHYFSLGYLKSRQDAIEVFYGVHPAWTLFAYFLLFVAIAGLSLPGIILMSLLGGALFGAVGGTVIVSFASTIGATLAFLSSRYLFRNAVQARYRDRLRRMAAGIARDGAFYLFTLRMIHVVPFSVINLAMGLTPIRAWTFYWVSQVGMLTATIIYVTAGTQLTEISSISDVFTAPRIATLSSLALLGLASARIVDVARMVRVYAPWRPVRPARFERNLVVIGGGSAGLASACIAAALRAKVTLIERHRMGGDHLNTGCVPSKALIRSSRLLAVVRRASEFGLHVPHAEALFAAVMERVRHVIGEIAPHASEERCVALGVECVAGDARIASPWHVEVTSEGRKRVFTTRAIVIASGARPAIPPIPGIEEVGCLTSETVWDLHALPGRLLVLGAGPAGVELAQAFARLGSRVTLMESAGRILPREDVEASESVADQLRRDGVRILPGHQAISFQVTSADKVLIAETGGAHLSVPFDQLLCATGRMPRSEGLGLEALGIRTTASGAIEADDFLRTTLPNVTVCGDAVGSYQFAHAAWHTAYYATVNALFGWLGRVRVDYSVIPWCTFTEPEVARVGLNAADAEMRGVPYEVTLYPLRNLDRAIAEGETAGFVKVLTVPGKDRILGATIVGAQAAEMLPEFVLAMRHRLGLRKVLSAIHVYPTLGEANRRAADAWRHAHARHAALRLAERFHAWRRG